MKTIEIKELGYKFDKELSFKDKSWEEILKLKPKNKEFITKEDVDFIMENENLKIALGMNNTWEFIKPYWGYSVARLNAGSGWALLSCDWSPSNSNEGLGVRFKE